jgi:hypothetical protein
MKGHWRMPTPRARSVNERQRESWVGDIRADAVERPGRRVGADWPAWDGQSLGTKGLYRKQLAAGLITRRSQVQILPPLLERPRKRGLSVVVQVCCP